MTRGHTVSAVIPTRGRPDLVARAVHSALRQTYSNLEVIVVVDGPDPATVETLARISDPRLRVIVLPRNQGGSNARNAGVQAALGEWIAFLDDDDEWMPHKTECQLALARGSRHAWPIVSSRIIARTPTADYLWPRRLPGSGEHMGDYLFVRKGLFQGEGLMATPTVFTKRDLLLKVPFRGDLKKHQDWDWVLRATSLEGAGIEFESDPLVIVYLEENRAGISQSDDWRFSLSWIRENRMYVSNLAYGAFLLTVVAGQASKTSTLQEYGALFMESVQNGKPQPIHVLLYAGFRLFSLRRRHTLRRWLGQAA
ncbi:MAG: glycosyl transferase [Candidatus Acidoferrum typicum]|nr:glycosyl transferase [Candidatus Acidoferrum typicum]